MIKIKIISFFFFILFLSNISVAKEPSKLISEIVNDASVILSSSDPVEAKIIRLNNIAETSVDINGIGMYTLGKYRKNLNEDQKIKYKKLFKSYFLKSFSSRLVDYSDPKISVVSEKKLTKNRQLLVLF
jgi:phospholipid transport system substrate-binding protein